MKIALLFLTLSTAAFAQPNTCGGLTSVTDGAKPVYPPIARAAHVNGIVILLVSFKTAGEADFVQIVSGPPMLRPAATDYVKSWRANQYTGPRTCPIILQYQLTSPACDEPMSSAISTERQDAQHTVIHDRAVTICDPGAEIERKRRFLFF